MPRCRSEESQLARRAKQLLKLQAAASEVEVESSGAAASAAQSFETRGSTSMTSKAGEENEAGENVKERIKPFSQHLCDGVVFSIVASPSAQSANWWIWFRSHYKRSESSLRFSFTL